MTVAVEGIVVEGDHRGRALGFPTANIELWEAEEALDEGVYAGYSVRPDGSRHLSAISIGRRPTYYGDEGPLIVESHLLDFDGNLYGERLVVEVGERIRGQLRFDSEQALKRQMADDVVAVRAGSSTVAGRLESAGP